jgi:hypothetical protein
MLFRRFKRFIAKTTGIKTRQKFKANTPTKTSYFQRKEELKAKQHPPLLTNQRQKLVDFRINQYFCNDVH